MEIKAARRFSERACMPVYKKFGRVNQVNHTVCKYWLSGRCSRNPCNFLHWDSAPPQPKQANLRCEDKSKWTWENPDCHSFKKSRPGGKITQENIIKLLKSELDGSEKKSIQKSQPGGKIAQEAIKKPLKSEVNGSEKKSIQKLQPGGKIAQDTIKKLLKSEVDGSEKKSIQKSEQKPFKSEVDGSGNISIEKTERTLLKSEVDESGNKSIVKIQQKLCKYWVSGNCVHGDKCQNLHSWFCGSGFSMLARLEGHTEAVTGIVLPSGCHELYCGSKDKSVRGFDCNSGQCVRVADLGIECETLVSEGPWIFVGLPNAVKAWNLQARSELILEGPSGQVYAIAMFNDILFAGVEDGTILAWKSTSETSFYEVASLLKGHSRAVLSLVVGANMLFSGSADHTIRVWDPKSLQCLHTLNGHTSDVTAVLCWDSYLLSGSLDTKIKVWAATKSGNLEVVYECNVDAGVLVLCGVHDSEAKPILLCSCKDNTVRLYELPSFIERGRIFSKGEVQAIQTGPRGLFFTGDATGQLSVWKFDGEAKLQMPL